MFLSTDNRIKENNCFQFLDNIKHADGNKQLFFIPIYDSLEPKASWSHSSSPMPSTTALLFLAALLNV